MTYTTQTAPAQPYNSHHFPTFSLQASFQPLSKTLPQSQVQTTANSNAHTDTTQSLLPSLAPQYPQYFSDTNPEPQPYHSHLASQPPKTQLNTPPPDASPL